jgi:hypothetical protein
MGTRLTKLRLNEISGVDDPANAAPDWIVAKSAEFKTEIEDVEKAVIGLHELLGSQEVALYLGDDEDVAKARDALLEKIDADIEEVPEEEETRGVISKVKEIFGVEKTGKGIQPIVGAPAATREEVDRVTPAEVSSTTTQYEPTEDQGKDELGRDEDGKQVAPPISDGSGKGKGKNKVVAGNPNQPVLGAPGETRAEVDRVTPAETSASTEDRVTEDQGKDELGRDEDGKKVSEPITQPEDLAKAVGDVFADQLEPFKQALEGVLDRLENVEKAAATSRGLDVDEDHAYDQDSLGGAFAKAARGAKVNLR